ncbi:hypothetical protein Holit_02565 [Hollandina sp. SP2]
MADIIQPQMGLNFEQVWAALMENRQQMKETDRQLKETDRLFRESKAETERFLKESKAETDKHMKELHKSMGELSNRFGELAEHLVIPNIVHKFNALHYHFDDIAKERKFYNPETGQIAAEFDILLENETYSIGVEVKTKPAEKDVGDHIRRLEFLRKYKDKRGDQQTIRGAIAGAIMPDGVRRAALGVGLYVIERSGDTVRIEEPKPIRNW